MAGENVKPTERRTERRGIDDERRRRTESKRSRGSDYGMKLTMINPL